MASGAGGPENGSRRVGGADLRLARTAGALPTMTGAQDGSAIDGATRWTFSRIRPTTAGRRGSAPPPLTVRRAQVGHGPAETSTRAAPARWNTTPIRPATTTIATGAPPRTIHRSQPGQLSAGNPVTATTLATPLALRTISQSRGSNVAAETSTHAAASRWNTTPIRPATTTRGSTVTPPRTVRRAQVRSVPAETSTTTNAPNAPRTIRRSQTSRLSASTIAPGATLATPLARRTISHTRGSHVAAETSTTAPASRWNTTPIRPATNTRGSVGAPPRNIRRSQTGRPSADTTTRGATLATTPRTAFATPLALRSIGRAPAGRVSAGTPGPGATPAPGAGPARTRGPQTIRRAQGDHPSEGRTSQGRTSPDPTSPDRTSPGHTTTTGAPSRADTVAGLLLRQVIPAAAVVDAATAGVIRRMPPAPPTGTPRLGGHRGERRGPGGPDLPRSADPNWSFTGARGQRGPNGATIGARTAPTVPSVTAPGTTIGPLAQPYPNPVTAVPGPADVAARRGSLVDLLPPSLFERARAGLADPTGGASPAPGSLSPTNARSREGAVSSPIDDMTPRQQQIAESLTPREWDELVDIIVDRLEDRVLDELARRGRRFTPGVF